MGNRREDRHETLIPGRYRTGNGVAKDVTITDLSERGCRIYDRFGRLTVGAFLTLKIGPVGPVEAHVRWNEKYVMGIEFANPLHPSILDHIRAHVDQRRLAEASA